MGISTPIITSHSQLFTFSFSEIWLKSGRLGLQFFFKKGKLWGPYPPPPKKRFPWLFLVLKSGKATVSKNFSDPCLWIAPPPHPTATGLPYASFATSLSQPPLPRSGQTRADSPASGGGCEGGRLLRHPAGLLELLGRLQRVLPFQTICWALRSSKSLRSTDNDLSHCSIFGKLVRAGLEGGGSTTHSHLLKGGPTTPFPYFWDANS